MIWRYLVILGLPFKYRPTPNMSDLYLEDHDAPISTRYAEPGYQQRGLGVPSEATLQCVLQASVSYSETALRASWSTRTSLCRFCGHIHRLRIWPLAPG